MHHQKLSIVTLPYMNTFHALFCFVHYPVFRNPKREFWYALWVWMYVCVCMCVCVCVFVWLCVALTIGLGSNVKGFLTAPAPTATIRVLRIAMKPVSEKLLLIFRTYKIERWTKRQKEKVQTLCSVKRIVLWCVVLCCVVFLLRFFG
jgi:hypothetical protein